MKTVSIVVPLYNEEENVEALHREIKNVCEIQHYGYEIIFVDDGSTDRTFAIAKKLSPLKLIRFRKNFGQTAAFDAGIKLSQHEFVITMDGDLQNDPEDIPRLLDYLKQHDLDVVSGWRKKRRDPALKKIISHAANLLRSLLIQDGIHDSGCSLKVYRRECFDQISLFGEMHRFIPAILKIKGYKIGELEVNHRPRTAGKTKYTWKRTIKGFIDMISIWFWKKFAVRPLHLLGGMGLTLILFGVIFGTITLFLFLTRGKVGNTAWPIITAFLLLTGLQLFVTGLIADVLSKSYYETTKDNSYSIKDMHENT